MIEKFSKFKEGLLTGFKKPDDRRRYDSRGYGGDEDYDDYDDEAEDEYYEYDEPESTKREVYVPDSGKRSSRVGGSSKIVNINTNVQMQVVICFPETVEEAGSICDYVKTNKTVVVNLENVEHEVAQRIVDFLGGVAYALDGDVQSISNKVLIIAPQNVDISGQFKEELKANGVLFSFKNVK